VDSLPTLFDVGRELRPWRRRIQKQEHELIPFGWALGGSVVLAIGLTGLGIWLGLTLVGFRHFQHEPDLSSSTFYDLLKLVFGVVAGIGGVIALVVSYRKQRIAESAEDRDRIRIFNERFITASQQLGAEQASVRLAGVYSLAGLADDWEDQRQTCIDVLCAYLRMPYVSEPSKAESAEGAAWRGFREVRHTIIRIIGRHLNGHTNVSWRGCDFDFTGTVFDGGDFSGARFAGGIVTFIGAEFLGGVVEFNAVEFTGATVLFSGARFTSGIVYFIGATFASGDVAFSSTEFTGASVFFSAEFTGSNVTFSEAKFTGGTVDFGSTQFAGGSVTFSRAQFAGSSVDFTGARFHDGADVDFTGAKFASGEIDFSLARFTGPVSFIGARFTGANLIFEDVSDWAVPPTFPWPDGAAPPSGVLLPSAGTAGAVPTSASD
jgi:uncharacterized protein YjbI with pentapeptide repeats